MADLTVLAPQLHPPLVAGQPLLWLHHLDKPRDRTSAHTLLRDTLSWYTAHKPMHSPVGTSDDIFSSLSYAGNLLAIAVCKGAHVGVDIVQIEDFAESDAVAALYLPPPIAQAIRAAPREQHRRDFARAWAEFEARSKCLGQGICEYTPEIGTHVYFNAISVHAISKMPDGFTGALAISLE